MPQQGTGRIPPEYRIWTFIFGSWCEIIPMAVPEGSHAAGRGLSGLNVSV